MQITQLLYVCTPSVVRIADEASVMISLQEICGSKNCIHSWFLLTLQSLFLKNFQYKLAKIKPLKHCEACQMLETIETFQLEPALGS